MVEAKEKIFSFEKIMFEPGKTDEEPKFSVQDLRAEEIIPPITQTYNEESSLGTSEELNSDVEDFSETSA